MKSFATLLMFCLSAVGTLAYAQSTVAEPPILEQAEKELVEVFSERAVDFEAKNQVQAINMLRSLNVSDARFNQPTLKAMGDFASGEVSDSRLVNRALALMELSMLTVEQRVKAMLECRVRISEQLKGLARNSGKYLSLVSTRRGLDERFRRHPQECFTQALDQMKKSDQYCIDLLNYVATPNERSAEVLKIVMETIHDEDTERADAAMMFAADLVRNMKQAAATRIAAAKAAADEKPKGNSVNAKYLQYAKRIIKRADENRDGVIDASESKRMLISPAPSDTNGDGVITVEEYAVWMEKRSKK